jgi:hypothetical protein
MKERDTTATAPGAWDAMLKAVLLPNRAARVVREEPDGSLTLAVPTRKPPFMHRLFSWLIRVPKERLTVLDPIGAAIWRSCDGKRSVEEMVEKFATFYRLSFHESRVSVTGYVTTLLRRGVLAVAVDSAR